jgi:MFS family permease
MRSPSFNGKEIFSFTIEASAQSYSDRWLPLYNYRLKTDSVAARYCSHYGTPCLAMPPMTIQSESSPAYPGWKVVLAGFFGVMGSFAVIVPYTFGLFLKPLSQEFGWHRGAISAGFSIAALMIAIGSPWLGLLLDRYNPKRIVLPCIVVFSLSYASLAWLTSSILRFYGTFFLIGLVGNGTAYLGYSRAISSWFRKRRGFALSVMLAGGGCGAMILPILTQSVLSRDGWRVAYVTLAVISFVAGFPLAALFLRERPSADAKHRKQSSASAGSALRSLTFWILAVTVCLYAMSLNGALAHLAAILTDRGVAGSGAAYCVAVIGATSVIGRLLTGLFLDRFFGPRVSQLMLLMTVAGIALLSVASSLTAGLVASGLIGFSMGSEGDITPYLLSRYFGLERFSTLYGLTWTAYASGAAIGPILVGRVFDVLGSYRPLSIQLLALPAAVPCILMFLLPRYPINLEMPASEDDSCRVILEAAP